MKNCTLIHPHPPHPLVDAVTDWHALTRLTRSVLLGLIRTRPAVRVLGRVRLSMYGAVSPSSVDKVERNPKREVARGSQTIPDWIFLTINNLIIPQPPSPPISPSPPSPHRLLPFFPSSSPSPLLSLTPPLGPPLVTAFPALPTSSIHTPHSSS